MASWPRAARAVLIGAALSGLSAAAARAQTPDAASGAASPGRVEEQVRLPAPADRALQRIEVRETPRPSPPPGADSLSFTLRALTFEGATVYGEKNLQDFFAGKVGGVVTLADLYVMAEALTARYRNDGYILTQVVVPPQTIDDGVARLQVVEGYVDTVSVQGAGGAARDLIQAYAEQAARSRPLNVRDLERALLLANDMPGLSARGILGPSKTKPGAADLTVEAERKPYDAQVFANTFGTRYLGPYQLGGAVALNAPLGLNERITLQTVFAPGAGLSHELAYMAGGYEQPVGIHGTTVRFTASHTDTDPGYTLDAFGVKGRSDDLTVTVLHPFVRSRPFNVTARAGLDWRNVKTEDDLESARKDRVRALRLGAHADYLSAWGSPSYNALDVELSRGLGVLGASKASDEDTSRPGAGEDFTRIEAEAQRLQRVIPSVNLLAAAHGQWSADPLLSSEEFGVGGMEYGRGYDPSEIVGDLGFAAKLEMQWQKPARIEWVDDWQVFGFYDVGTVWNREEPTPSRRRDSLASTGLGLRSTVGGAGLDAVLAFPLTRRVETEGDTDPRLFLGVNYRF